jgi:hypothetical protein
MALPLEPTNTQRSCTPLSSNCVTWQGPDISCINLCKGDSISDVTYKVAVELCTLLDELKVSGFDVSCFPPISPRPETIKDIIQFILDQICSIQNTPAVNSPADCATTLACLVPVPPCLQYPNPLGDMVVELSVTDFATLIGNTVCGIIDGTVTINKTLAQHTKSIDSISQVVFPAGGLVKSVQDQLIVPSAECITKSTNVPIVDFVQELELAFCNLQTATGNPSEITSAIGQQCINLDTLPTLSNPTISMSSLPGWLGGGNATNMAAAVNNLWVTLCDMRSAVQNVVNNCCNTTCDDVQIVMDAQFSSPNIELAFNGSAGSFVDCFTDGMFITITDAFGLSYTQQVQVIPNLGGGVQTIDLSGSLLNLYTDYTVKLDVCASNGDLTCNKCLTVGVENFDTCPSISYSVGSPWNYIDFGFTNPINAGVTYIVECWNNALTAVITTNTFVNPESGTISGSLTGLTPNTRYQVRVRVIIGGIIKDCDYQSVITD